MPNMNHMEDSVPPFPLGAWIGMDISKDKIDACLLRESGNGIFIKVLNTSEGHSELMSWARRNAGHVRRHFCMESTGRYGDALAIALHEAGEAVSVLNPVVIKYSGPGGSKNKTDKADARKIARFARQERPALWEPRPEPKAVLTELVRHIDMLTRQKAEYATRLKNPGHSRAVRASLERIMSTLGEQIDAIQREADEHVDGDPGLKAEQDLIDSVRGIGKDTAQLLLAEMPPIDRVPSAQALAAFFGLSPKEQVSGKSRMPTHVSKCGNNFVRAGLYWPAITAMRHNEPVKQLAARLAAKGRCKLVIIVAAMRKLLMQVYGVLKHRQPFDQEWSRNHAVAKA
jgi:transposase